jgi:hypothetical protein
MGCRRQLPQQLAQLFGDRLGCCGWREPGHHVTGSVHQKFLEVPGDIRALGLAGLLGLEPLVQLGSVVAVHVDLGEHREIDVVVVGDEGTDFFGGAGLLLAELVAREAEDADPVVVMMKRTQTCVLRRDASSGGDVDDETGLIGEVREGHLLTLKRRHGEVVESAHGGEDYPAHGAVSGVTPWCVWPTSAPLPRRLGTGPVDPRDQGFRLRATAV